MGLMYTFRVVSETRIRHRLDVWLPIGFWMPIAVCRTLGVARVRAQRYVSEQVQPPTTLDKTEVFEVEE